MTTTLRIEPSRQEWNSDYYREVLTQFARAGYRSATFSEFDAMPIAQRQKILLHRLDVDERLDRVQHLLEVQTEFGTRATYFIHVHATYNCFFYEGYKTLRDIIAAGCEIGLHSNFVEFAHFFDEHPDDVLRREKQYLEALVGRPVLGQACHRDINYVYNSLPYLERAGHEKFGFRWHAYQPHFTTENMTYVSEGFIPRHLNWSNLTPEQAIALEKNICLLIHPHWWHRRFPTGS